MSKLLIKNGHVIDPKTKLDDKLDILISGLYIEKIAKDIKCEDANILDATGLTILPGLFDMHSHLREPGFEYKEDINTGTKSAAAGGFCKVACMPNTSPVNDSPEITRSILSICKQSAIANVLPIGAITEKLQGKYLTEMGMMKEAGCVAFSDDGNPVISSKMMYLALKYAKNFDALLISHCEDSEFNGDMNEGFMSSQLGLRGIPNSSETIMVSRDILLAEELNTKVHIAHISTEQSVSLIRDAKRRGVDVTCETCPHYIAATDEMVLGYDTNTKVNPPLRTEEDRLAIIEGIKDGTIDVIATDHAPHHIDDKRVEYSLAANGISGFESAFSLCYTFLVEQGHAKLERLIELMSYNPLNILKQNDHSITEKNIANITIAALDIRYDLDTSVFLSKGKNNPFDKWNLAGKVMGTIIDGNAVFWNGKLVE